MGKRATPRHDAVMSLATRCGHCGTIFRVVQDQLKVSEGWVRCGRCGEVFNALQALFDLEREAPPPFPGRAAEDDRGAVPTRHTPLTPAAPTPRAVEPIARTGWGSAAADVEAPPAAAPVDASGLHADTGSPRDEADVRGWIDDGFDDSGQAARQAGDQGLPSRIASGAARDDEPFEPAWREAHDSVPPPADPARNDDTRAEPGFDPTRQDDALTRVDDPIDADRFAAAEARAAEALPTFLRDEPVRGAAPPLARAAWAFGAVLLTVMLAGQVAVHHRDAVAQAWPWSRPLLAQWCVVAGCEVLEAPRRLDAFTVETSSLTRQAPTGDVYRFSVTLRNRSTQPVLMPSIDLSLDDAAGQLLSRRALNPADFRVARPVVASGAEATLQLVMSAANGQASGYRIELFYP
jgi:predicted Zn finger-like uncharacterized protein